MPKSTDTSPPAARSPRIATALSIAATLALGPVILFVAQVVAPALLPRPEAPRMQLTPLPEQTALPAPQPWAPMTANIASPGAPDPIAARWRLRTDGTLDLPMEARPTPIDVHAPQRKQP